MNPEERNLVTELFDRLATLEDAPRDREAEGMIQDGLRQAPNAPYALVQTVLVQDEALKRADARIRTLEAQLSGGEPPRQGGFLDPVRESVWGRRDAPRAGSVPTVRPSGAAPSGASMGVPPGAQPMGAGAMGPPSGGTGGSFLGTAAAAAVGAIGGSLLFSGIRSMMGGQQGGTAHAAVDPAGGGSSPWGSSGSSGGSSGSGDLGRQAGLDDIGRGSGSRDDAGSSRSHGLVDGDAAKAAPTEESDGGNYAADDEDIGDFGGDDQ